MTAQVLTELRRFDVSLIADGLDACGRRDQVLSSEIRPLLSSPRATVVGVARTMELRALEAYRPPAPEGRLQFVRKVEATFGDGDVLAIGIHGEIPEVGVLGDLYAASYKNLGVRALIIEGFIRDRAEIEELGLPVYARGATPRNGVGRVTVHSMGEPISLGGVAICSGDFLAMNADGIVAVPSEPDLVQSLLDWLAESEPNERRTRDVVAAGGSLATAFEKYGRL